MASIVVLAPVLEISHFSSWPFRLLIIFCFASALTITYLSKKGMKDAGSDTVRIGL
ncbi:hypothetical protein [Paenibacillus sp. J22TS3]|uniref:hypothetical protein n=1 Tax=Paenibacillus sp. J22TS3 TaxID=2807192 RepID=UPI001B184687|nr:hypothetical protein [Paenibacillus sp. J22TS3]GIP20403.1 hypothetical protein J22TS3_06780 [Paenibacillus sp. J22TS3]